jgi:hypothetical protein
MRIFRKFKFKIRKWWKTINDSPNSIKITKAHNTSFAIFRVALKNPKSELILMPIANKRIIKLEKQGLYIKLERFSISITNHKYNYMIEIPYTLYEKLVKMFDSKIDNNYYQEEAQMINQLEAGIDNVLKTIMKNNG